MGDYLREQAQSTAYCGSHIREFCLAGINTSGSRFFARFTSTCFGQLSALIKPTVTQHTVDVEIVPEHHQCLTKRAHRTLPCASVTRAVPDVDYIASTFSYTPLVLLDLSSMGRVDSTHEPNSRTSRSFTMIVANPPQAVIGLFAFARIPCSLSDQSGLARRNHGGDTACGAAGRFIGKLNSELINPQ